MALVAADGHAQTVRMPPYKPGSPPPVNFLEWGDCSTGNNPASSWEDTVTAPPDENGGRARIFFRHSQGLKLPNGQLEAMF